MRSSVLFLLSTVGCLTGAVGARQSSEVRDKDVYAAVLDSLFGEPGIRRNPFVLGDSTSAIVYKSNLVAFRRANDAGFVAELFRGFDYVDGTTVRSFEDRNQRQVAIPDVSPSRAHVVRVFASALDSLPVENKAHWKAFYEKYPGTAGLVSFSPIGYSDNGSVAIVMVGFICGPLCGQGYLVGLQLKMGKWYVTSIKPTWTA